MEIKKDTSIAVVVNKTWANLYGVRMFLRDGNEIKGSHDTSHIVLGRVLNSTDPYGLWITNTGQREADPAVKIKGIMIPWNQILTVVLQQKFSPELWAEAKKMGFVTGSI